MHNGMIAAALTTFLVGALSASDAQAARGRLVFVGVQKGPRVSDDVQATVDERIRNALPAAAKSRDYTIVPLANGKGVPAMAKACAVQKCRREIAKKLKAGYVLSARLERLGKAEDDPAPVKKAPPKESKPSAELEKKTPADLKDDKPVDILVRRPVGLTFGSIFGTESRERTIRGYQLTVWLEGDGGDVFLEGYKIDGATPFLVGQVPDIVEKMLEAASPKRLVTIRRLKATALSYRKAGRYHDADRTLRRAVSVHPFHPEAARVQALLVQVWVEAGESEKALQALDELVQVYGPSSAWGRAGIGGPALQKELRESMKGPLLQMGTTAHEKADAITEQEAANPLKAAEKAAFQKTAREAYTTFVDGFEGDDQYAEIAYYLADLEFSAGRYKDALPYYEKARDVDGATQAIDAGIGAMNALLKLIEGSANIGTGQPFLPEQDVAQVVVSKQKKGMAKWAKRYRKAGDAFATRFPTHKNAPVYLLHGIMLSANYGHKAEAKRRINQLNKAYPGTRAARLANTLKAKL